MEKYYFGINNNSLIVMSEYEEFLKKVELGITNPAILGQETQYELLSTNNYDSISFWKVKEDDILKILEVKNEQKYEILAFHDSLFDKSINLVCKHLVIGENSILGINIQKWSILNEVSFLNIKSFKGDIQGAFEDVKRLILFEDSRKLDINKILPHFPNIEYLFINNSVVVDLDLSFCSKLKELEVHRSRNLETIKFHEDKQVEDFITTSCKKLVV